MRTIAPGDAFTENSMWPSKVGAGGAFSAGDWWWFTGSNLESGDPGESGLDGVVHRLRMMIG